MNKTLLTVNVVTYNHRPWIEQCLDSILEQETDFGFIVRIFDDCSTDGTTDICKQYAEKYPDKVYFYPTEKNLGPRDNPLRSYQGITTPYYLYIEGDDYRIDKHGFQEQVDILEKHPECSFCAAKTVNLENGDLVHSHPNFSKGIYSKDFILQNPSLYKHANLGVRIVRTKCINFVKNNEEYYLWDISQFYELFESGSMYFIDKDYMVYRMTMNGLATSKNGLEIVIYMSNLANMYIKYKKDYYENIMYVVEMELMASILREEAKRICKNAKNENICKKKKNTKRLIKNLEKGAKLITPPIFHHLCHFIRDYLRKLKKTKKEHSNDA